MSYSQSGIDPSLYQTNPILAQALFKQQQGQQLYEQGVNPGPISAPSQGWSALAKALLGGYEAGTARRQIQDAGAAQNAALAQYLNAGSAAMTPTASNPPASPQPMQSPPTPAGAQPPPNMAPIIQRAANANNVPLPLANALLGRESNFGKASPNLGQVTTATAANPGFGVAPLPPSALNDPQQNANFSMAYLRARANASGAPNLNDPAQQAIALRAYNGGGDPNYVQHVGALMPGGGQQLAQASTGTMSDASGAPIPQQPAPPTGMDSPQVQRGMQLMHLAQQGMISSDPRIRAAAQGYMQQAQTIMGLDSFQPYSEQGRPGNLNTRTNEFKPFDLGRPVLAPDGSVISPAGGVIGHTAPKLDFVNGQGVNPTTGQPMGAPVPPQPSVGTDPASGASGYNMPPGYGGNPNPQFVPMTGGSRGPEAMYSTWQKLAAVDGENVADEQKAAMDGRSIYGDTQTIRSLVPMAATGLGADARAQAQRALIAIGADPKEAQNLTGTNASIAEILNKTFFKLTATDTRALGAREPGSVLFAFQKNYPSLSSQPQTIQTMTNLLDMRQAYKEDAAAAKRAYFDQSVAGLGQGQAYKGLTGFQAPDPKIYAAAGLAASGLPTQVWTHGLTPQEQVQAVGLVRRQYPDYVPPGYAPTGAR